MANRLIQLTPAHVAAINQAKRVLNDLVPELNAAQECGVDCADKLVQKAKIMDGLDKLLTHFAPEGGTQ